MTIRERGGKVQLIRNQYSPEKKRGVQIVLGSFDRYLSTVKEIDSMLLEQLTEEERGQLDQWFADKSARSVEINVKYAPKEITGKLELLTEHYDPASVSDDQISDIQAALSALLAARRKHRKGR